MLFFLAELSRRVPFLCRSMWSNLLYSRASLILISLRQSPSFFSWKADNFVGGLVWFWCLPEEHVFLTEPFLTELKGGANKSVIDWKLVAKIKPIHRGSGELHLSPEAWDRNSTRMWPRTDSTFSKQLILSTNCKRTLYHMLGSPYFMYLCTLSLNAVHNFISSQTWDSKLCCNRKRIYLSHWPRYKQFVLRNQHITFTINEAEEDLFLISTFFHSKICL